MFNRKTVELERHIHCPECLQGLIKEKCRELWTDKKAPKVIFYCDNCTTIFSWNDDWKLVKVFK